jgi:predicted CXXCH cytochrome family protein
MGFIKHDEPYNELLASSHPNWMTCVTCHDPHKPTPDGIKHGCGSCHEQHRGAFQGSTMSKEGVTCVDCHMPRVVSSAESHSIRDGDVRTHVWKISSNPKTKMFTDNREYVTGVLTIEAVCLICHDDRTVEWAASYYDKIHVLGK